MNNVRPQLTMMSEEQIQEAHRNVLKVLEQNWCARGFARHPANA